ncbi:hypothetical protein HYU40_00135 [Candidatus Woesearchaeota archaeon]|nr:hypothetical protein [Candidatus Woesearchaeota archaeon]
MTLEQVVESTTNSHQAASAAVAHAKRRQPHEILIRILSEAQRNSGRVHIVKGLNSKTKCGYVNYLAARGLVEKQNGRGWIVLTEAGWAVPLKAESFKDYSHHGGRRTRKQVEEAVAGVVYRHNGKASPNSVMQEANLSYELAKRYISHLRGSKLLQAEGNAFTFTGEGRSRFADTGAEAGERRMADGKIRPRRTGEVLAQALKEAKEGKGITALMYALRTNHESVMHYTSFLCKKGLLECDGGIFRTTPLYGEVALEALPAALDLAYGLRARTRNVLELDLLAEMSEPASATQLYYAVAAENRRGSGNSYTALEDLVRKGLAVKSQTGRVARYQITPKGQEHVARVNWNLKLLKPA